MSTPARPVRASRLAASIGPRDDSEVTATGTAPVTNRPETTGDPEVAPGTGRPRRPARSGIVDVPAEPQGDRFTARFSIAAGIALDELRVAGRRRLGGRIDKVRVLEALIMMAADDATIRDELFDELAGTRRKRTAPAPEAEQQ
jgi:hypothetical protein